MHVNVRYLNGVLAGGGVGLHDPLPHTTSQHGPQWAPRTIFIVILSTDP